MTPFEDHTVIELAAWLDGKPTPQVPAVRVPCASEEEWLAARVRGIGASEISVVVGVPGWSSPYALWWRKKLDWRIPRTDQQRWGHLTEDPIATLFAEDHHELFVARPVGSPWSLWAHRDHPFMLCTPDRLAVDRDGVVIPVEIKSDEGGDAWGEPGSSDIPDAPLMQALWQAAIFGAPGTWVARKRGSGRGRLASYWVPLTDQWRERLAGWVVAAAAFLESIERGDAPEPDGSRATEQTLKMLNPAVADNARVELPAELRDRWTAARAEKRAAAAAERAATRAETAVSNALRAAMGKAEYATVDGTTFARRKIGKRAGYVVATTMVDELREVKGGQRDEGEVVLPDGGGGARAAEGVVPEAAAAVCEEGPVGGVGEGGEVGGGVGLGEGDEGGGEGGPGAPVSPIDPLVELPPEVFDELVQQVDRAPVSFEALKKEQNTTGMVEPDNLAIDGLTDDERAAFLAENPDPMLSWRPGQTAFNVLYQTKPELADEIRGTELDPFYDDDRLPAFWAWLNQRVTPVNEEE